MTIKQLNASLEVAKTERISLGGVTSDPTATIAPAESTDAADTANNKLPSGKLAQKLDMKTADLLSWATEHGYMAINGDKHVTTPKVDAAGIEFVAKGRFGPYFLWPLDFQLCLLMLLVSCIICSYLPL